MNKTDEIAVGVMKADIYVSLAKILFGGCLFISIIVAAFVIFMLAVITTPG